MPSNTIPALLLDRAHRKQFRTFVEVWSSPKEDGEQTVFSVSYAELADSMITAALWLCDGPSQVRAGDYVALLAHNSVAYLAFSLGAMSLGAVSVNLNWRQSAEITAQLLGGLQPRLLLASSHFHDQAREAHTSLGIQIAILESICNTDPGALPFAPADAPAAQRIEAGIAALDASRPAAVFFTGGTTGIPKAVPHSHAGLCWFAARALAQCPAPYDEVRVPHAGTVCFTPFFHVMGFVANFVFNIYAGCRVALLASPDDKLSPLLVLAACRALRPSVLNTVPWVVEGLV